MTSAYLHLRFEGMLGRGTLCKREVSWDMFRSSVGVVMAKAMARCHTSSAERRRRRERSEQGCRQTGERELEEREAVVTACDHNTRRPERRRD